MLREENRQQCDAIVNLLNEYADILDELEGALESFEVLYADIGYVMDDIRDELEKLQEHLKKSSSILRRYHKSRQGSSDVDVITEMSGVLIET